MWWVFTAGESVSGHPSTHPHPSNETHPHLTIHPSTNGVKKDVSTEGEPRDEDHEGQGRHDSEERPWPTLPPPPPPATPYRYPASPPVGGPGYLRYPRLAHTTVARRDSDFWEGRQAPACRKQAGVRLLRSSNSSSSRSSTSSDLLPPVRALEHPHVFPHILDVHDAQGADTQEVVLAGPCPGSSPLLVVPRTEQVILTQQFVKAGP